MFNVSFYADSRGISTVGEWVAARYQGKARGIKNDRILFDLFNRLVARVKVDGTLLPNDIVEQLSDEIWELKINDYRIMFCNHKPTDPTKGGYVLLSVFYKKTNKTPPKEIAKAERLRTDWISRNP